MEHALHRVGHSAAQYADHANVCGVAHRAIRDVARVRTNDQSQPAIGPLRAIHGVSPVRRHTVQHGVQHAVQHDVQHAPQRGMQHKAWIFGEVPTAIRARHPDTFTYRPAHKAANSTRSASTRATTR